MFTYLQEEEDKQNKMRFSMILGNERDIENCISSSTTWIEIANFIINTRLISFIVCMV